MVVRARGELMGGCLIDWCMLMTEMNIHFTIERKKDALYYTQVTCGPIPSNKS